MSNEQGSTPQAEPTVSADAENVGNAGNAESVAVNAAALTPGVQESAAAGDEAYVPTETRSEIEVGIVRSVRIGPVMIGAMILGAAIAALAALFFPVAQDATYTLAQAAGFASLVGAVIGLLLGGILVLILGKVAKRQAGAARAVLTDVR